MRASMPPVSHRTADTTPRLAHQEAGTSQAAEVDDAGPSARAPEPTQAPPARPDPVAAAGLRRPGALSSAAYLWTRWMRQGMVDPAEASLVTRAHAAIERTQAQLPWGRGNVVRDVVATGEDSTWRTVAGRGELPPPSQAATQGVEAIADRAAEARFMGAGNCDEFVALLQVHLVPDLKPSERLEQWGASHPNHTWCELVSGQGTGGETRWVVDPWAEGRVLPALDTRMHDHPGRIHVQTVSVHDAPTLTRRHEDRLAELQDATTPEAAIDRARLNLSDQGGFPYPAHDSPDVWNAALQNRTLDRVRRDLQVPLMGPPGEDQGFTPASHPLRRVLPFVGAHAVARQLGADLRGASAVASQIVQAGVSLGLPRQRPIHVQPEAVQRSTYQRLMQRAQADLQAQATTSGSASGSSSGAMQDAARPAALASPEPPGTEDREPRLS